MRYGHIVTVGTSLISNDGGTNIDHYKGRGKVVHTLKTFGDIFRNGGEPTCGQKKQAFEALSKLKPECEFNFRSGTTRGAKDRMPQELSYLYKFAQDHPSGDRGQDEVQLLCSDTLDSKACAEVIARVLSEVCPWKNWYEVTFDVGQDFAEGVDAEKGEDFRNRGLHAWMGKIQAMVESPKKEGRNKIFLNVTGGYKGTVPYSTLMGMLYPEKVEVAYLFEESQEIIYIPTYPVGLDFRQWHENALRLRMKQEEAGKRYFIPDPPVKNLLRGDDLLSALGNVLQTRYKEQLYTDPLKVYSKDIVTRLLHDKGPYAGGARPEGAKEPCSSFEWKAARVEQLRGILHRLIDKVGDLIWLGDKLPEMVEHAQRHHHDLLEFTELFLTPILYHKPDFLNDEERFVLLSAVLLHDSGHSLDRISVNACKGLESLFGQPETNGLPDEIPLLPNDIRDYHQYLAGIRLNDPKMGPELGWCKDEVGLCLHEAVILACLYHRRRMDYDKDGKDEEKDKYKLHLTGQWPGPLKDKAEKYKQDCGVDLMKVVALLRLIDGCDSQTRRAGPPERVALSMSHLQRDYETAAIRARQAYEAFKAWVGTKKEAWSSALREEQHDEGGKITQPWEAKDDLRECRIKCLKILEDSASCKDVKQGARLWLMAAEAADRAKMRSGQWFHFMKHRAVSEVRVLPGDGFCDGKFSFNVILAPNCSGERFKDPLDPSSPGQTVEEWLKSPGIKKKTCREEIEKEVSSEYAQVAGYAFCCYNLEAMYWWEADWDNGGKPFFSNQDA